MDSSIPIANIYYLLCYAWNRLEQGKIVDVSHLPSTELVDLFAFVLCDGIRHLARRGLEQGYEVHEEELSGIRGRIDIAQSLRRSSFLRGRAHCRFDELSVDTIANQVLKSTLISLLGVKELDRSLRRRAYSTARSLHGVSDVKLTKRTFDAIRVTSNNLFYRFLLSICRLIFDSLLVDQESGVTKFRDFTRDEKKMALLFQSFLSNFIARECSHWKVKSENIAWQAVSATDPSLLLLPLMQTDISAVRPGEYRIIDAKFYRRSMSYHFGSEKFHSENLYQLCSYLMNARTVGDVQASGMLIYPRVDRDIRARYEILGRTISICTVNLNASWQAIDAEIRDIMC
ncbi:5-methylcytosine-specific restriction enzyme subunit McrC [Bradyrhizobium japonicum]